jgi:hypothetical protein
LSKQWLIINAVIIAVALIVVSLLVENVMPFIYGAGALNLINVIAYSQSNKTEKQ